MIKSIISGFGRTLGRFLFYVLLGLLAYLILDNWDVNALTNSRDIVEINVNYNISGIGIRSQRFTPTQLFLYDNQYFSNSTYNGKYVLGYWELYENGTYMTTNNINFYFPSSCSSSEMLNYNINIYFYCQNSYCPSHPMHITSGNNTCSGNWLISTGNDLIYQLNCNAPAGSLPLGSLYFQSKSIGLLDYRVAIQKNFNYTCDVNSQAIIENQNVNTDRTIQAITDLNGNITIINNALTDETPLPDSVANDITDMGIGANITGNARFSDIVLLAPQVLQHLLIDSNTCVQANLGELYGSNLYLPCIQPQNFLGTFIWGLIDVMFCIALLFPFIQWLVSTTYKIIGLDRLDPTFGFSEAVSKNG